MITKVKDTLQLRQAVPEDIPGIQRVRLAVQENTAPPGRITDAAVLEAITTEGRGWVIVAADEVLGFAIGNRHTGNIWALFIDPSAEGCGYGRQLHDTMLAWLWQQGLNRLWLSTAPNTRAESVYRHLGWQTCGVTDSGEILFEQLRPPY